MPEIASAVTDGEPFAEIHEGKHRASQSGTGELNGLEIIVIRQISHVNRIFDIDIAGFIQIVRGAPDKFIHRKKLILIPCP